jgi:tRNA-splicing ligase RtcB
MSEFETLSDGRLWLAAEAGGVPVRLNLDESLTPPPEGLEKLRAIAALPELVGHVDVLPDVHFKAKNFIPTGVCLRVSGKVAPMLVGPPNDSMMMATLDATSDEITSKELDEIFAGIMARIAMFRRDAPISNFEELTAILRYGATAVAEAWGFTADDLAAMDYEGRYFVEGEEPKIDEILSAFPDAKGPRPGRLPDFVPWHDVMSAAAHTLGVLDGGGHFMELGYIREILGADAAAGYGLRDGQLVVAAHVGPADVGLIAHRQFLGAPDEAVRFHTPDSTEGRRFLVAMGAAANFAFANRLYILKAVRDVLDEVLGRPCGLRLLSDAPHDLVEELPAPTAGEPSVYIHRKGVVRGLSGETFAPGHRFAAHGRPFFFPTCLGEDSLLMTRSAPSEDPFDVCSHGLGRSMTREEAMQNFTDEEVLASVAARGVRIYRYGHDGFSAQAPGAHKDANKIKTMLKRFGLANPVASVRPLASLKG